VTVGEGGAGGLGGRGGGGGYRTASSSPKRRPQSAYVEKNLWVDGEGDGGGGSLSGLPGEHVRNTLGTQGGLLGLQGEAGGAVATVQLQVCSRVKDDCLCKNIFYLNNTFLGER
jgi:hypothetical protein